VRSHFTNRLLFLVTAISIAPAWSARAAAACTPTGFFRDGIEMTAAFINPTVVPSPVNATGCHIGVYVNTGVLTLNQVDIFGATYFGVLVNGDGGPVVVHLTSNLIHNIGEGFGNGDQHGAGIYLRGFFDVSSVTGEVNGNFVTGYQKSGIVANGKGVKTQIRNNKVVGYGHVNFIAQNGIQIGFGAAPVDVTNNEVHANSFIGLPGDGSASAGILVVGGPGLGDCPDGNPCPYTVGTIIGTNILFNNDVGVFTDNEAADHTASTTPTSLVIYLNAATSDACFNQAYQAAFSDFGNSDFLVFNYPASGGGYDPPCGLHIDTTGSINPTVINFPGTTSTAGARTAQAARPKAVPFRF